MSNNRLKKSVIFACVLLLQSVLTPMSSAWARKKAPMRAYSFIAEAGKASQSECDGVRKIPGKLKRVKEMSNASSYMGSELEKPELEIKGKPNEEMWTHYFRAKASCNSVLAKTPSAKEELTKKIGKPELPPEDPAEAEAEEDGDRPEASETPEVPATPEAP